MILRGPDEEDGFTFLSICNGTDDMRDLGSFLGREDPAVFGPE